MPNHVTNIIEAPAEVIASLTGENGAVDFNTVVPFPEELRKLTAEHKVLFHQDEVDAHNEAMRARDAKLPEPFRAAPDAIHAITVQEQQRLRGLYGPNLDWYNWNTANWGTKWNAYDIEGDEPGSERIQFDTAWAHPAPAIQALSEKFPEAVIRVQFADEDWGANYGEYTIQGGERSDDNYEHLGSYGDEEAMDFVLGIKNGQTFAEYKANNPEDFEDED